MRPVARRRVNVGLPAVVTASGAVAAGGRWGFDPGFAAAGLAVAVARRRFVLDFPAIAGAEISTLQPSVTSSAEVIGEAAIHGAPTGGMRLSFEFDPRGTRLSELRAVLHRDGQVVSEVWTYRWLA